MSKKYDWKPLQHPVVDQKEPNLHDLNDFIEHYPALTNQSPRWQVAPYEAAKLKRDALLREKDALTLTMSREQLLYACNPHWTDGFTIKKVDKIWSIHAQAMDRGKEELFFKHFEGITNNHEQTVITVLAQIHDYMVDELKQEMSDIEKEISKASHT